jgi:hypothetical protein
MAWRVVCEDGSVHSPVIAEAKGDPRGFFALSNEPDDGHSGWGETERLAVIDLARKMRWSVAEIVAPATMTSEERVTSETKRCAAACRDIARAYLNDINGAGFPRHSGAYSVADGCANAIEAKQAAIDAAPMADDLATAYIRAEIALRAVDAADDEADRNVHAAYDAWRTAGSPADGPVLDAYVCARRHRGTTVAARQPAAALAAKALDAAVAASGGTR